MAVIASVVNLVDALQQYRLLDADQLQLVHTLQARYTEPKALAKALMQRGWLSPFQINQLFLGRGNDLMLGPYLLIERLGEGGMGQVFKVRHELMNRVVALKVIRKERLDNPEAIRRFRREVQAAAQLSHPNIIIAHDAAQVGETHFLVTEYVEGMDLAKLVKARGTLPVMHACVYIRQAALGLQHAHERGLVHRDIKPSNLLVAAAGGQVKILDFGLARLHRRGAAASDSSSELTKEGTVMGTPDFLAPEQARDAHVVDIRADIYSLGCTLYYLLTGQPPFPEGAMTQKLLAHQGQEPQPIRRLRRDVTPELAMVLQKMMAKRPEDRYQTPAELAAALRPFIRASTIPLAVPVGKPAAPASQALEATPSREEMTKTVAADIQPAIPEVAKEAEIAARRWFAAKRARLALTGGGVFLLAVCLLLFLHSRGEHAPVVPPPSEDIRTLDDLNPAQIPADERFAWQPRELVAVLGNHRWRHWGPVRGVAFSPDGKEVASIGDDGLRLWDAATGRERLTLGHAGGSVAFSTDSKTLASVGGGVVKLWQTATGREGRNFSGVNAVAFSADGKTLAGGCSDATVKLWDVATGELRNTLQGHKSPVLSVAFSADGETLASGSAKRKEGDQEIGGEVKLWDVATGQQRHSLQEQSWSVEYVAYTPDGKTVATATPSSGTIRLWDSATEKVQFNLPGHPSAIFFLVFAPDGQTLVSAAGDSNLKLWDVATGKERATLRGHAAPVYSVAVAPHGRTLASGSHDGAIKLWDIAAFKEGDTRETHLNWPIVGAIALDSRWVATGNKSDHAVKLWEGGTEKERITLFGHTAPVNALTLSADGKTLASGSADRTASLWDTATGKRRVTFHGHNGTVSSVLLAPDVLTLVSSSYDNTTKLWDATTGKEKATLSGRWTIGFTADGQPLAAQMESNTVKLWDVVRDKEQAILQGHKAPVRAVAFSADGRTLASGSQHRSEGGKEIGGEIKLWDVVTGKEQSTLQVPKREVDAIAFSPDGKMLASGGYHHLKLWDVATRKERLALQGDNTRTQSVVFAPDGQTLVSRHHYNLMIRWHIASGKKLNEWSFPGPVHHVVFSSDSRHLATVNGNGTVYILRLAGPSPPVASR